MCLLAEGRKLCYIHGYFQETTTLLIWGWMDGWKGWSLGPRKPGLQGPCPNPYIVSRPCGRRHSSSSRTPPIFPGVPDPLTDSSGRPHPDLAGNRTRNPVNRKACNIPLYHTSQAQQFSSWARTVPTWSYQSAVELGASRIAPISGPEFHLETSSFFSH